MTIKPIDKQRLIFRINGTEYQYLKPHTLMKAFGEYIQGRVKGGTLGWYIEGGFVSYNQIKNAVKEFSANKQFLG